MGEQKNGVRLDIYGPDIDFCIDYVEQQISSGRSYDEIKKDLQIHFNNRYDSVRIAFGQNMPRSLNKYIKRRLLTHGYVKYRNERPPINKRSTYAGMSSFIRRFEREFGVPISVDYDTSLLQPIFEKTSRRKLMEQKKNWTLLGKQCRDIVSGAEGITSEAVEWLYGCTQYSLIPSVDDNTNTKAFFENQLEVIGPGITDKVNIPEYIDPLYIGAECKDKVTGLKGFCVGRAVSLFTCDQYILEHQPEDTSKPPRVVWLDEGRVEPIPNSNSINAEDVKSPRNGSLDPVMDIHVPGFENMII